MAKKLKFHRQVHLIGIGWRWNFHHETFFPDTCHYAAVVTGPAFGKHFSSALFFWDSHLPCKQQTILPFILNCQIHPLVDIHQANKWTETARCFSPHCLQPFHQRSPITFKGNVILKITELYLTFTQWTSHTTMTFIAAFSSYTFSRPLKAGRVTRIRSSHIHPLIGICITRRVYRKWVHRKSISLYESINIPFEVSLDYLE